MGRRTEGLCVDVPRYFLCPISLEVMKSPVSLCTGITYDRSSIQRWLDDGHNTCPATMQVLHTRELVPNHTLRRLIRLWSNNRRGQLDTTAASTVVSSADQNNRCLLDRRCRRPPEDLLREIRSSADPLPSLRKLAAIARDADRVHLLTDSHSCALALGSFLAGEENRETEVLEEAVRVLAIVVLAARTGDCNSVLKALATPRVISSVVTVLRKGNGVGPRTAAVRVLESIAALDTESKLLIAETDGVLSDLAHLITDETDPTAIDAGLSLLAAISTTRRLRAKVVRVGIIPALGKLLHRTSVRTPTAEKALQLLEVSSTCAEGRAAICEDAECVVTAVMGRMMKVSAAAEESAVAVLWRVCHAFGDRRAREAAAGSNGLTKLLLLMQSNCSAASRGMAADLLRFFMVNSKSRLSSYDTKTAHITPF